MPLDLSALEAALEEIAANPPATIAGCAAAWAAAMKDYATGIIPVSTTIDAAVEALESALATAFAASAAAPGMETAFAAFATTVAAGMAPAFTGTPPPNAVGFATQFAMPFPETHAAAAVAVAGIINTWMKSGTATSNPPGTTVNWT